MSTAAVVAIALGVALVIGIGTSSLVFLVVRGTHGASVRTSHSPNASASEMQMPVTADSKLLADGGRVVFKDDFTDPSSGWPVGTVASGSTYRYTNATYVVVGKGTLHHIAFAPYTRGLTQLSMEVSATQTAGAPTGAGFGVTCDTGNGSAELHYELLLLQPGTWYLERSDGPITSSNAGSIIKQGSSDDVPGVAPLKITGMCATLEDGKTTRLALFVNGLLVASASDSASAQVGGWVGGVVAASRSSQVTTVTFTKYLERDLSGGG